MPFFLTAQFTYLCFTTHYTLSDVFLQWSALRFCILSAHRMTWRRMAPQKSLFSSFFKYQLGLDIFFTTLAKQSIFSFGISVYTIHFKKCFLFASSQINFRDICKNLNTYSYYSPKLICQYAVSKSTGLLKVFRKYLLPLLEL